MAVELTSKAATWNESIVALHGATSADIRALVGGVEYHVAVDAVNSNGVTLGTTQVPLMHAAQHSRKADASPG